MRKSRVFLKVFSGMTCVTLLFIGCFCYQQNPYSYFRSNYTDYYNLTGYTRLVKPHWFLEGKYEAVFVGTSRTFRGANPLVYERLTNKKAYNLSMPGMHFKEAHDVVAFLLAYKQPKDSLHIVLGADTFFSNQKPLLNPTNWLPKSNSFIGIQLYKIEFLFKILMSSNSMLDSYSLLIKENSRKHRATNVLADIQNTKNQIETLTRRVKSDQTKHSQLHSGSLDKVNISNAIVRSMQKLKQLNKRLEARKDQYNRIIHSKTNSLNIRKDGFSKAGYNSYNPSNLQESIEKWDKRRYKRVDHYQVKYFESLLDMICSNQNIRLTIYLPPFPNYLTAIIEAKTPSRQIEGKTKLAKKFIKKANKCNCIEFYDYWISNSINSTYFNEGGKSKYFNDFSHHTPMYGDQILSEILSTNSADTKLGFKLEALDPYRHFLKMDKIKLEQWQKEEKSLNGYLLNQE